MRQFFSAAFSTAHHGFLPPTRKATLLADVQAELAAPKLLHLTN
jgi:hypothetical protein